MKTCPKCGAEKGTEQFSPDRRGRPRTRCKPCCAADARAYLADHKEEHRRARLKWYWANRERSLEGSAAYHAAHKEEKRATNKAWRAANPDKGRAKNERALAKQQLGSALAALPPEIQELWRALREARQTLDQLHKGRKAEQATQKAGTP